MLCLYWCFVERGGGHVNVLEILSLKEQLQGEASDREALYDELEEAYGGGSLIDRQRKGAFPTVPKNPFPDRLATERGTAEIVANICFPIVESTRSFIGQLPSVRVPPKGKEEADMVLAEKQERVTYGLWDYWNMARRMSDIGLYCSLLGTAVGVVWPDIIAKRPKFVVRSPRGFYEISKDEDGYELAVAMFVAKYDGRQVAKMFGKKEFAKEEEVEVVQYIDDEFVITIAGGKKVDSIPHGLGFCPVVCIPNIGIPGSPFGDAAHAHAVRLQKEYNYARALQFSVMEEQFCQPLVLPSGSLYPAGLPNGPRDIIELPEGVTMQAYRLPPMNIPFDVFRITDDLDKLISAVSDMPQAMTSSYNAPYMSGSGFQAQLGPAQAKLKVRMESIYPALRRVHKMAFKMFETMWPNEEHVVYGMEPIWGRNEKAQFVETFKIDEFGGWYECDIFVDASTYFDEQSRWVEILQAIQNQLLSKETAMQYNPFVKPGTLEMEKRRIQREVEENIQQNLAAQQQAASLATQNAPMNEPGKTEYGLKQGYLGEMPPAPVPGGMEVSPTTQGSQTTTEVDPRISQAADLIRSIPNLKGRVYIVGDYLDPAYLDETSGEGAQPTITLALTDLGDKATILNYVKKTVPEMIGAFTFTKVGGEPTGPHLDVSSGTSGYEIVGGQGGQAQTAPTGAEARLLGAGVSKGIPQAGQEKGGSV